MTSSAPPPLPGPDDRTPITGTTGLLRAAVADMRATEARLRDAIRVFREVQRDIVSLRFLVALLVLFMAAQAGIELAYVLSHAR